MHIADCCERFGVILEAYLSYCGNHFQYLHREYKVNAMIQEIAEDLKQQPKRNQLKFAQEKLAELNTQGKLPPKFTLCLSPRIVCTKIVPSKCKVMSSKKLPLWLCFEKEAENADPAGERYLVLFKEGDDLRQDLLTLQLLRVMDRIWVETGTDFQIVPYGCCATGHDLGMLEVVTNSNTTANIQRDFGGGAVGAFRSVPIVRFIKEHNTTDEEWELAKRTFMYSCAGYCVATFVLGIGDRHADNIMVTEAGNLFHIDFGHFLGNFKKKFGINRERAPFVFTPEMAYVFNTGEGYSQFEGLCAEAYNALRAETSVLVSLFMLLVPARMPELLEASDIGYLCEMLKPEITRDAADKKMSAAIKDSLHTVSRQVDNWFHALKHG